MRKRSANICRLCGGIIPINDRSAKRELCKECNRELNNANNQRRYNTNERLKINLLKQENINTFLKEYADRSNWGLHITRISKKLDIPSSTIEGHAKRYRKEGNAHSFFLKEYADPDNWRPNLSLISRKTGIPISTIWQYMKTYCKETTEADADTTEVYHNGKNYHFEWDEKSIQITECCHETGDHDNCILETYDFARIE